jgi:alanine racemase
MLHTLAKINLAVLAHNIETVRRHLAEGVKILFMVKSDAYGHGVEAISRVAEEAGIFYLGTSTVEEGSRIRRAGVGLPILLLNPVLPSEVDLALDLDFTLVVSDLTFAQQLARVAKGKGKRVRVQVNVDTGMRRFGIAPREAISLFEGLRDLSSLEVEGVFSHLATAISVQEEDRAYTIAQVSQFESLLDALRDHALLPPLRHIGNSAGVIGYEEEVTTYPLNMVRIGTLLYGYPEVARPWIAAIKPVATLTTRVITLRELAPGDYSGYNRTYRARRAERIAILPIGYGTGIPPQLANRGKVLVKGKHDPIIGAIGLAHTAIDVTGIDGVSLGEEVEVFGPHLPADRLAETAGLAVCELLVPALQGATDRTYV